ncbi:CAAD domain-containing protein, partial [Escherichia coli]
VLELVGIGYTGWFAYKNLVYKPDREALTLKIKATYKDIIGSS